MGFFDKFKKKINEAVEMTGDVVSSTFRFDKLKSGLERTRRSLGDNLKAVLGIGKKIDENLIEDIESILITSDIGVDTTDKIINSLRIRVKNEGYETSEQLYDILQEEIYSLLKKSPSAENDATYSIDINNKPHVIMVIGVNGVGKTTTIGKLAHNYKSTGKDVLIGAADTYRAAANEQLEVWAKRAGVPIIQQAQGADPAAVAYDTLNSGLANNRDVVIIDTAGRLHNKSNLMAELSKINRVLGKLKESAPDEVFLVLDATTGQNAIQQAKEFLKVANITGIVLTKLDGTAKGGVVIPIATELNLPVRYIGVGERIDDLQAFDPEEFVAALFSQNNNNNE